MPTLSVLTPSYNDGAFVLDCVGSVRDAAVRAGLNVEHIVVDDGSTDDTQAVLNRFPHLTRFLFPANKGASAALNFALRTASGDWCLILAADDVVAPTAFADWLGAVRKHPVANVVYSDLRFFGTRDGLYKLPPFDAGVMRQRNILPGASFIRRDLLLAVGGFDESMPSSQDWDFWIRAHAAVGLKPVKVPLPMIGYRQHATPRLHNESGRNQAAIRAHIQALPSRAAA